MSLVIGEGIDYTIIPQDQLHPLYIKMEEILTSRRWKISRFSDFALYTQSTRLILTSLEGNDAFSFPGALRLGYNEHCQCSELILCRCSYNIEQNCFFFPDQKPVYDPCGPPTTPNCFPRLAFESNSTDGILITNSPLSKQQNWSRGSQKMLVSHGRHGFKPEGSFKHARIR